jgi:hypothetical protein
MRTDHEVRQEAFRFATRRLPPAFCVCSVCCAGQAPGLFAQVEINGNV